MDLLNEFDESPAFPLRKRDLSKDIYIFKNSFQYAAQKARTARASETMPLP